MPRRRWELVELLEREIRKVLIDSKAPRTEKLKAIDAGARIAMVKHKIQEATDGAAGSFFAREPTAAAGAGPKRVVLRTAAEPGPDATPAPGGPAAAPNGAGPSGAAPTSTGPKYDATDPFGFGSGGD